MSDSDPRDYLRVLRRRKWWIALTVAAVVGLTMGLSALETPVFSASAKVLIVENQATQTLDQQAAGSGNDLVLVRNVQNEILFARGDAVRNAAQAALGRVVLVTVSSISGSDLITFTVSSPDATLAAKAAGVYANAYIQTRRQSFVDSYLATSNVLQQRITDLQAGVTGLPAGDPRVIAATAQIQSLNGTLQTVQVSGQLTSEGGGSVVSAPAVPSSPSSPNLKRNAILAAMIGLLAGCGLAFGIDHLDDSIKSRRDLELIAPDLPVVGAIPRVKSWKNDGEAHIVLIDDPRSEAAEAYRTLRTSLQFLSLSSTVKVIAVTSANSGEGKSATSANLAIAYAKAGFHTVVVCCDLRRPRLHCFFGKDNAVGLTSVILGEALIEQALQDVDSQPRLRLLASGPTPPNPVEFLALAQVRQLIQELGATADVVILDCPPVLPVADTLVLSGSVDATVMVVRSGDTVKRDFGRGVDALRQVQSPLVGTILNDVPNTDGHRYGTSTYGYGYSDEGTGRRRHRFHGTPVKKLDRDPIEVLVGDDRAGSPAAAPRIDEPATTDARP